MKTLVVQNYGKMQSAWKINDLTCARAAKRVRARLRLVCAHLCMDLYKKIFGNSLLSYEPECKIS